MPNVDPYVYQYIPPLPPVMVIISARIDKGGSSQIGCSPPFHSNGCIYFDTVSDATDFVNAYYVLKRDAGTAERAAEAAFAASAKKYREMPVKPALRDDVDGSACWQKTPSTVKSLGKPLITTNRAWRSNLSGRKGNTMPRCFTVK